MFGLKKNKNVVFSFFGKTPLRNIGFLTKNSGAAHRNICRKTGEIKVKGAAHRDIKLNIAVRCTFKTRISYHCYKYYGALHLL
jgi:hypothetical protein